MFMQKYERLWPSSFPGMLLCSLEVAKTYERKYNLTQIINSISFLYISSIYRYKHCVQTTFHYFDICWKYSQFLRRHNSFFILKWRLYKNCVSKTSFHTLKLSNIVHISFIKKTILSKKRKYPLFVSYFLHYVMAECAF